VVVRFEREPRGCEQVLVFCGRVETINVVACVRMFNRAIVGELCGVLLVVAVTRLVTEAGWWDLARLAGVKADSSRRAEQKPP